MSERIPFREWMEKVVKIEGKLSFMLEGYQTGEIFEWHEWWYEGLSPEEAIERDYELYA